ncbi:hypothetical protein MTR67_018907 [Solanum verrucosum]|uniref:Gag-pol polyprotein n=1 Tax=Solanum verrucosum TaxID=315347 RepID=A0AAF0TLZ8_SOLVR|nr:hypothetical protein MTR67_018907 [Solanum verrucosum]
MRMSFNVKPKVPLAEKVSHAKFLVALQVLAQAMTAQANREIVAPLNPNVYMEVIRGRNLMRMNPPEFYGLKVEEDPQEFIEGIQNMMDIMGVTLLEKADLVVHQLKWVTQVLFSQ